MGRKVVWAMAFVVIAVVSAGLVGGQVGGFWWWGTHEPIYIFGDDDFTTSNGVMSGSGTAADPYIIEGWSIAPANADYGVYIDHTTSHFVVRDCVIEGARVAGVYLNSVKNGRVEGVQIVGSDTAVFLLNSSENRIEKSVISECRYGVVMAAVSQENVITGNSFVDNGLAAYDPQHWNIWYEGKTGNYWSDYRGVDQNKDGVGDEPYYPLGDQKPLMTSPVELTEVAPAGPSYAGNLVAPDGSLVVTSQTPITLTSADLGSGLAEIKYSIDGGTWTTYSGPILLKGDDGPRKVTYYGIDKLGNAEPKKTVSFLLDNHAPQTVMDLGEPKFVDARGTWITSATVDHAAADAGVDVRSGGDLLPDQRRELAALRRTVPHHGRGRRASGVVLQPQCVRRRRAGPDEDPAEGRRAADEPRREGWSTRRLGAECFAPSASAPSASAPSASAPVSTASAPSGTSQTTAATAKPVAVAPSTPSVAPTPATTSSGPNDLSGAALGQSGATVKPVQTESTVPPTITPSAPQTSSAAPAPSTTQTPSQTSSSG